ncbi:hypothetical protein CUJ89_13110 [Burkholderia pyrrocinia]|uniref:Type II toxin-antitoxin system PemK/MazF family toxin n=2 Tax=Burkholderia pyrrocinia TaxID=60550 RepID=A0A2Z5MXR0_BURPY|nr:hypothetical protein CUJ89_13110 [Burkholderia pyrrocinia]
MTGSQPHLHVVLSNPIAVVNKGKRPCVVVVNFSSIKGTRFDDLTCVFSPQDHRYFRHKSFVFYAMADVEFADAVMQNVSTGIWPQDADFTAGQISRIKAGLLVSQATPTYISSLPI